MEKGKKQLHEHELFLFAFTLLFIFGGFIFWNVDATALNFFHGETDLNSGDDLTLETQVSELLSVPLTVTNDGEENVALFDIEILCTDVLAEDTGVPSEDCSIFQSSTFVASVLAPAESESFTLTFLANEAAGYTGSINFLTSETVATGVPISFSFTLSAGGEGVVTDEDTSTFIEELLEFFAGAETETTEEVEEEPKTPIAEILYDTIGLTATSFSYGSIAVGEQKTKTFEIENLATTPLILNGILKKPEGIVVSNANTIINTEDERAILTITCAPPAIGDVLDETSSSDVVLTTNRGDVVLTVSCVGVQAGSASAAIDEQAPTVVLTSPPKDTLSISGILTLEAQAVDDGGIGEVKFYLDEYMRLIGFSPKAPYKVTVDTTRMDNGFHTITVKAVDNAGNHETDTTTIFVDNQDISETIVSKEKPLRITGLDTEKYGLAINDGSGYTTVSDSLITSVREDKKLDLKLSFKDAATTDSELQKLGLEIKFGDVTLNEGQESVNLEEIRMSRITRGNVEIIDFGNTLLSVIQNSFAEVETVTLPMLAPQGVVEQQDVIITYYTDAGEKDITNQVLHLDRSDTEIWKVTVPISLLLE